MTDSDLLADVALGTVHRTAPGSWSKDRIELSVTASLRLDALVEQGAVVLFDTGAGYQYASVAG